MTQQEWLTNRKSFIKKVHDIKLDSFLEKPLKQTDTEKGRFYKTPTGNIYPSVTSVTGIMNREALAKWRAKIGEEEANNISQKAAWRGTKIHKLCEDYINGNKIKYENYNFSDQYNFLALKNIIDNNIDNIHLLETRLYSNFLRMAGTVDCIAEFNGRLSIIDFKTSMKLKEKDYITNYFCQASAYAVMYEELFGIPVPQIVILISVDNEDPQIFVEKRNNYTSKLIEVREQYFMEVGI